MLTQTLINVVVLVYFSVTSAHVVHSDLHVVKKAAAKAEEKVVLREDGTHWTILYTTKAAKTEEKVVLRESTLSEKCGLGLEAVARPDEEIAALRSSAGGLKSALALGEQITKATPEKPSIAGQCADKFVLIWDGESGAYFDGMYYPPAIDDESPRPVKCILVPKADRSTSDEKGLAAKPDCCSGLPASMSDFLDPQAARRAAVKPLVSTDWKKKFVLISDGEKGYFFSGTYYPTPECDFFVGDRELSVPVDCVVFSPPERSLAAAQRTALDFAFPIMSTKECRMADAKRTTFPPDARGRTPNDFYDYDRRDVNINR